MIQLENVSKSFSTRNLFSNVNLALRKGMRVGLVGKNGSGKTTLLKLILGTESCDSGLIKREKNVSIGYLAQEIVTRKESTIIDEVLSSYPEAIEIEKEISDLSKSRSVRKMKKIILYKMMRRAIKIKTYALRFEQFLDLFLQTLHILLLKILLQLLTYILTSQLFFIIHQLLRRQQDLFLHSLSLSLCGGRWQASSH